MSEMSYFNVVWYKILYEEFYRAHIVMTMLSLAGLIIISVEKGKVYVIDHTGYGCIVHRYKRAHFNADQLRDLLKFSQRTHVVHVDCGNIIPWTQSDAFNLTRYGMFKKNAQGLPVEARGSNHVPTYINIEWFSRALTQKTTFERLTVPP